MHSCSFILNNNKAKSTLYARCYCVRDICHNDCGTKVNYFQHQSLRKYIAKTSIPKMPSRIDTSFSRSEHFLLLLKFYENTSNNFLLQKKVTKTINIPACFLMLWLLLPVVLDTITVIFLFMLHGGASKEACTLKRNAFMKELSSCHTEWNDQNNWLKRRRQTRHPTMIEVEDNSRRVLPNERYSYRSEINMIWTTKL